MPTEFELDILQEVRDRTPRPWGAAVGVALESLKERGFIEGTIGNFVVTDSGHEALEDDDR